MIAHARGIVQAAGIVVTEAAGIAAAGAVARFDGAWRVGRNIIHAAGVDIVGFGIA